MHTIKKEEENVSISGMMNVKENSFFVYAKY